MFKARCLICFLLLALLSLAAVAQTPESADAEGALDRSDITEELGYVQQAVDPAPTDTVEVYLDQNLLGSIRRRGEIRIGISPFIPWAMRDKNSRLIGHEVDIARKLAEDLGVTPRFVITSWGNLLDDLLEGRTDIIVSGFSITPQRALLVDYSEVYSRSSYSLLARKDQAGEMNQAADFNSANITIGVEGGTVSADIAREQFANATVRTFDNQADLYRALLEGELQALIGSSPRPELEAAGRPNELFIASAEPLSQRGEAIAVRKGNQSLLNYLNAWVRYYHLNGYFEERRDYWFRSTDWTDQL